MTEEQIKKVVENRRKIDALNDLKHILECTYRINLSFTAEFGSDAKEWEPIPRFKLMPIEDILDKHDKMIRQEIDERIAELEKELEEL